MKKSPNDLLALICDLITPIYKEKKTSNEVPELEDKYRQRIIEEKEYCFEVPEKRSHQPEEDSPIQTDCRQ